jgi:spermidine/putrescine transport system substrate-binding protein
MLSEGTSPGGATLDDVLATIEVVREQLGSGQLPRFTGNDYTTDLSKGNVWAAVIARDGCRSRGGCVDRSLGAQT